MSGYNTFKLATNATLRVRADHMVGAVTYPGGKHKQLIITNGNKIYSLDVISDNNDCIDDYNEKGDNYVF